MRRPLSWSMRFALALSAVFAIGTLSAGGLSYLFLSREMTARLSADVRSGAESLAQIAATGDRTDLREQIHAQVRSSRDGASLFAFVDAGSGEALGSLHVDEPFEGARRLLVGQDIPESDVTGTENAEAYLAYGGLTWDDVERVDFGGFGASWTGLIEGQTDAAFASTNSGNKKQ